MNKPLAAALSAVIGASLLAGVGASLAFAQTATVGLYTSVNANAAGVQTSVTANATAQARLQARIQDGKKRANEEITRRINALNALEARVGAMVRVSSSEKASISTSIQAQISALTSLENQIASDNSTTTLKVDIQSITESYRIYMLVLPQGTITAASDRINTVVSMMQELGTKLQTRISAAASAGANVSVAQSALADYNSKVADASTQANAAESEVVNLQPDNGNASVEASNTATLKDARSKLQLAQQDLVAARKDVNTIRQNLPKESVTTSTNSSTSVSGQ